MTHKFLRLSNLMELPEDYHGGVIAIGNFDGVHRGHQAVLQEALNFAKDKGKPAIVYTFEPHPRSFFNPQQPVDRLTSATEKAKIFKLMGFDAVVEQKFDAEFANLSAEDFIHTIIQKGFSATAIVTGSDFHFGKKRSGNPEYLKKSGEKSGFDVIQVAPFCDENGIIISSSRIREFLSVGNVEEAAKLLGYRYTVTSEVIHGAELGRTLGFPTANMALPATIKLAFGIYAVRFRRKNGELYNGVASFGRRPTVEGNGVPLLETYLFSFNDNLYEEIAAVSFYSYLREEIKFDGLESLIDQMNRDREKARKTLETVHPLSTLDEYFTFKK